MSVQATSAQRQPARAAGAPRSAGWGVAIAATLGMSASYIDRQTLVVLGLAAVPTSLAFVLWPSMRRR